MRKIKPINLTWMNISKKNLAVSLIAFVLNMLWEFSHQFLYVDLSGIPKYVHLIIAAFIDMLIIFGIFLIISLKNKNFDWINYPNKFDYFQVILYGCIIAILIEIISLNFGIWEYNHAMPMLYGIGISPLIQLAITGILSLIIFNSIKKQLQTFLAMKEYN